MHPAPRLPLSTLAFALALLASAPVSFAQATAPETSADQQHSAHHPGTSQVTQTAAPTAPAAPARMGGGTGMMTAGGMGPMTSMMRGMVGDGSAMMVDHVEGRLAFLRTELKITDAQMPQWSRFTDALRSSAKSMSGMQQQMMQDGMAESLPARLELHVKMLSARLDALKTMEAALDPLYASLSDEQKKIADELMMSSMGMMM
jgi:hypothetical protein